MALLGALIVTIGTSTWAAEDEKRIINGPSKTSFGGLELVLGQGASAETAFQPDASKLIVKTLVGEARIVTSAKNLILVESTEGRVEILLPNGRLIVVEPGKAEIVGRALVDDPGNITIRLSGTGPIAQAGGTHGVHHDQCRDSDDQSGQSCVHPYRSDRTIHSGKGPTTTNSVSPTIP